MTMSMLRVHPEDPAEVVHAEPGESNLSFMYRHINCRTVTCVTVEVGGEQFDLWCDDEALFNNSPELNLTATAAHWRGYGLIDQSEYIFGTVLVAKSNPEGETLPVDEETGTRFISNLLEKCGRMGQ